MHLVFVHPRLEVRGFPRNPLTRESTCTQAIHPGASGSTLTPADNSRESSPPGHSLDSLWSGAPLLAHGAPLHGDWLPNPTGLLLGVFLWPISPCSDQFATLPCPVPLCDIPSLAQSPRPVVSPARGAVSVALATALTWPVTSSHPSCRIYTPPDRQQPSGAGPLDPHPSRHRFVLLAGVLPIPSPVPAHLFCSPNQLRMIQSGALGHTSHVKAPLAYLCNGTSTQRL